jgi:hypothetical protein
MFLIHRQILYASIHLARPCKYNPDFRVFMSAHFEKFELANGIDFQILQWILHTSQMTHLTCEIEQDLVTADKGTHPHYIPYIHLLKPNLIPDPIDIESICA